MTPLIGRKVVINGDYTKTYTVGRQVVSAFVDLIPCTDATTGSQTTWVISSIKYNGVEQLLAPHVFTYGNNSQPTVYHYYDEYLNVNDNLLEITHLSTTGGSNEVTAPKAGFAIELKSLIAQLGIPVNIGKAPSSFLLNIPDVNLNGDAQMSSYGFDNVIIEKREEDDFEVTFSFHNNSALSCATKAYNDKEIKYIFNGVETVMTSDGSVYPVVTGSIPSWDFECMNQSNAENGIPTEVPSCITYYPSFNSGISLSTCNGVNECCTGLSFSDSSTILNTMAGHDIFGYRLIRVTNANGLIYEYSSATSDEPDQLIGVLAPSNNNDFTYSFTDADTDGVWSIQVYNFPEWQGSVLYSGNLGIIVHKDDKLWKCIQSSAGIDPVTDTDNLYWEEYSLDVDALDTRYGYEVKIVVLCIALIGCYKKLIEDALCSTKSNPCAPICENKKMMNAMKIRVIWDAINNAECNGDYLEIESQLVMWKSICSCVNC